MATTGAPGIAETTALRRYAPALGWGLCWLAVPLYGLLAVAFGQDANWDLMNYHFYNPYAFLHERHGHDILVAHLASFYNPLLDVPFYWLVVAAPPWLVGFVLGAVQGLNAPLLYAVARRCWGENDERHRPALGLAAAALAIIGLGGGMALSEVGTSYGDNVVSLFVFAALLLVLRARERTGSKRLMWLLAAGIVAGAAGGLKQPTLIYAVGLCAACLVLPGSIQHRLLGAVLFGGGVLVGIALTDGFWLLDLWQAYGNPLFPYFNQYFLSPMAAAADYRDDRFTPANGLRALLFPYLFTFGTQGVSEVSFFDLRPVVVYSLFLLWPFAALYQRMRPVAPAAVPPLTRRGAAAVVLVMIAVSWLIWLKLFGIYRYIVPLELLMPLAIVLLLDRLPLAPRGKALGAILLLAAVTVSVTPANWSRLPWRSSYFGVTPPAMPIGSGTAANQPGMVLLVGLDPVGYLVPFFPPEVRFVRIEGFFNAASTTVTGLDRVIDATVRQHRGPLAVIYRKQKGQTIAERALAAYGLRMQSADCRDVQSGIEAMAEQPLRFCPVTAGP